jgi:hypothetical protein
MRLFAFLAFLLSAAVASGQQPNPPTALSAVASTGKTIRLTWTAPSTAGTPTPPTPVGFFVYRAEGSGGSFVNITTFGEIGPASTSYTDDDPALVAGTLYRYQVVSFTGTSAAPVESERSNIASATPAATPGVPGNFRATDITYTSVSLEWNAVDGATSYTIYRDDDVVEEDITGTSFEDIGLTLSTTYTYNVTANSAGGESAKSADLVVTTFGDGTGKEALWAKRFRQIDIDASGFLTYEEYLLGHGGRLAEVVIMHRYEYMDSDETTEGVTLTEYAKSFGGRKFMSPSRPRQFFLADLDANGGLDLDEFALTLGAKTSPNKVEKAFNKRNKNPTEDDEDTEYLTEFEFGIKNGSQDEPVEVPETP